MGVGDIVQLVVVAAFVLVGVAALWEFKRQRALQCSGCGRSGPFPERVVMALRRRQPASCPDCGCPVTRRGKRRSEWSDL